MIGLTLGIVIGCQVWKEHCQRCFNDLDAIPLWMDYRNTSPSSRNSILLRMWSLRKWDSTTLYMAYSLYVNAERDPARAASAYVYSCQLLAINRVVFDVSKLDDEGRATLQANTLWYSPDFDSPAWPLKRDKSGVLQLSGHGGGFVSILASPLEELRYLSTRCPRRQTTEALFTP